MALPQRFQNPSQRSQLGPNLFRVGGSGFTVFHWENRPIGFARALSNQAPEPVAPPVPIQPLDAPYPLEIITPAAIGAGSLQVQLFEMYNKKVWDDIMKITDDVYRTGETTNRLSNYNDLREVFVRLSNIGRGIQVTKFIYPPNKVQRVRTQYYAETFHNAKITDIRDDENIEISTMEVIKNLTIGYTHMTRHNANS